MSKRRGPLQSILSQQPHSRTIAVLKGASTRDSATLQTTSRTFQVRVMMDIAVSLAKRPSLSPSALHPLSETLLYQPTSLTPYAFSATIFPFLEI